MVCINAFQMETYFVLNSVYVLLDGLREELKFIDGGERWIWHRIHSFGFEQLNGQLVIIASSNAIILKLKIESNMNGSYLIVMLKRGI